MKYLTKTHDKLDDLAKTIADLEEERDGLGDELDEAIRHLAALYSLILVYGDVAALRSSFAVDRAHYFLDKYNLTGAHHD